MRPAACRGSPYTYSYAYKDLNRRTIGRRPDEGMNGRKEGVVSRGIGKNIPQKPLHA